MSASSPQHTGSSIEFKMITFLKQYNSSRIKSCAISINYVMPILLCHLLVDICRFIKILDVLN